MIAAAAMIAYLMLAPNASSPPATTKTESTSDFLNEVFQDNDNFKSSYTTDFFQHLANINLHDTHFLDAQILVRTLCHSTKLHKTTILQSET